MKFDPEWVVLLAPYIERFFGHVVWFISTLLKSEDPDKTVDKIKAAFELAKKGDTSGLEKIVNS